MNLELFMEHKWEMSIHDKRINMREKEEIMKISLFLWVFQFTLEMCKSVIQLTHIQSPFPSNKEEEQGRLEENYSDPHNPDSWTSPTRGLWKKALSAGSKHSHTCKKSTVQNSTNHECAWADCFSWSKESFFLGKWAFIIIPKVLSNFVLIHSKLPTY